MAESVEEAMQVLDSQRVDILFTDICMPEQDGLELIRQAKEHQPGLHCVIYSAFGEFDYAKRAMQYGVRHYILKPLKLEEFRATIQAVLEDCRKSGLDRRKEQLLRLLLLGQLPEGEFDIGGHLLLADMSRPLFADSRYDLEAVIGELFGEAVWVSLNEYQAVLVAGGEERELEAAAQAFCRRVERDAGHGDHRGAGEPGGRAGGAARGVYPGGDLPGCQIFLQGQPGDPRAGRGRRGSRRLPSKVAGRGGLHPAGREGAGPGGGGTAVPRSWGRAGRCPLCTSSISAGTSSTTARRSTATSARRR